MKKWALFFTFTCAYLLSSSLQEDKLYILMGHSGTISIKNPVLSLYTLTLEDAREQMAELPPTRTQKQFTLGTGTAFASLRALPVTSYSSRLTYQTENAEQKTIPFFEIYNPQYDPLKRTASFDFQVFVGGKLTPQKIIDPAVFFSVSYIPRTQEKP